MALGLIHIYPVDGRGRFGVSRIDAKQGRVEDLCGWGQELHERVVLRLKAPVMQHESFDAFMEYLNDHAHLLRSERPDAGPYRNRALPQSA